MSLEPIPETVEAIEEYGPFAADGPDLLDELKWSAQMVRMVVPECVGITLASTADAVSFTLVASEATLAVLDAIQYAAGGPCVEAVKAERVLSYSHDELLDEGNWHLFSQATAAAGIASTLTLPILVGDEVSGSINLYAAKPNSFDGLHQDIADIFHAWAPGAVANADLEFSTRSESEQAPRLLREQVHVQIAISILMRDQGIDEVTATFWLKDAAHRAGVTIEAVAERLASGSTIDDE